MAKAERYDDLILQLGDLARERLANRPTAPRSMERVFKAEEVVLARRDELAALEEAMNEEAAAYEEFLEQLEQEREENQRIVKQWKKAVDAIQGRVKEVRKKMASLRSDLRYEKVNLKKMEQKAHDLALTMADPKVQEQQKTFIKKVRLSVMRRQSELTELQAQFDQILTPSPGQPGAQGILAHKRLLELEDEAEDRKYAHEDQMTALEIEIAAKEEEVRAAEEFLDQAVFLLGEDCYTQRFPDPALAALYPRLDVAK